MVTNYSDEFNDQELDWDDEIDDGQEFIILPEGDYNFTITDFERGRFPGSAKIDPCKKATLTLQVESPAGKASVKTDILLSKTVEFKIAEFFRCIGQKKQGEKLKMDWSKVLGSKGHAHFKPREYTDKNGEKRQVNDVSKYYDYDEKYFLDNVSPDDDLPF